MNVMRDGEFASFCEKENGDSKLERYQKIRFCSIRCTSASAHCARAAMTTEAWLEQQAVPSSLLRASNLEQVPRNRSSKLRVIKKVDRECYLPVDKHENLLTQYTRKPVKNAKHIRMISFHTDLRNK